MQINYVTKCLKTWALFEVFFSLSESPRVKGLKKSVNVCMDEE